MKLIINYFKKDFLSDFLGAITVSVIALPIALAFGEMSGLGVASGLYSSIFSGFFAAFLGGSVLQITGPTAPATVLISSLISNNSVSIIFGIIILAGLIQILFGVFKLGKIIEYLPYPIISGFMTGVALLIFREQLKPDLFQDIFSIGVILFIITFCFIWNKYIPKIPPTIIVLVVSIVISYLVPNSLKTIGELPSQMPIINFDIWKSITTNFSKLLGPAFSLAFICSIDSLLTACIIDTIKKDSKPHNSNLELISQGAGNFISGVFGGLAGAGATVRSIANVRAGAVTRLSGMMHSIIILSIIFFFGWIGKYIPSIVISSIVLYIALTIIDYDNLKRILITPISDVLVMFATIFLTIFAGLLTAIEVSLFLAVVLFTFKMSQLEIVKIPLDKHVSGKKSKEINKISKKIAIFELKGPLFFGSTNILAREISNLTESEVIVLKMYAVPLIDQTGLKVLDLLINEAKRFDVKLIVTGLSSKNMEILRKAGWDKKIGEENFYHNPMKAIEKAINIVEQ